MSIKEKLENLINDTAPEKNEGGIKGKVKITNLHEEVLERIDRRRKITLVYPSAVTVDIVEGNTQPFFFKIIDDLMVGNNVYLHGPAGTGKTTLAKKTAYVKVGLKEGTVKLPKNHTRKQSEDFKNKIPFIAVNCNQWTSPARFIGGQTIDGYVEGDLIYAWENGKMLILDELPKLDANTAGILNDALAEASKEDAIIFTGEGRAVQKHPNFCVVATGNTTMKTTNLQYGGNNQQDASLIDRFSSSYYFVDFDRDLEQSLVYNMVFEVMDKMRTILIDIESSEIITLRTMLNMNRIYILEMERRIGKAPANPSGKTLKDSVLSFLGAMDIDERRNVEADFDLDNFFNRYANTENYLKEKERFNIKK